ncbi:MAG: ABC transporter permease [Planctomycetes bacterium]|nr:ABC transporter permease [Planctomycetota bacterium]
MSADLLRLALADGLPSPLVIRIAVAVLVALVALGVWVRVDRIAWISLRNVHVRKLSSGLTTLSVALGAGLVAAIWLMIAQAEEKYRQSYAGYSAIVGPQEGAPLSLVLSTVMNLGYAPGVVPMSVYRELHDGRLAARWGTNYAIPQARGDYFEGFPIVGTTDDWFTKFARGRDADGGPRLLRFAAGERWVFGHDDFVAFAEDLAKRKEAELEAAAADDHDHAHDHTHEGDADHDHAQGGDQAQDHDHDHDQDAELPVAWRQAVIGADVAAKLGIGVGDAIVPSHGADDLVAHQHGEAASRIVGVLAPTGTPIDRCVYVPIALFLSMSGHEAIRETAQTIEAGQVQISAIIYDAKHPLAAAQLRYEFQTRDEAQVAWPHIEIAQLLQIVGNAADLLRVIAWLVVAVAAIGVCVALYNTMNERRREIAIMRSLGARRSQIVTIILLEATAIAFVGAVAGIALCHLAAYGAGELVQQRTSVALDWAAFSLDELWLILGVSLLGGLAGVVPAVKGSTTEVAQNLGPVS